MPSFRKIIIHPWYLEVLLAIINNAKPGPGIEAGQRLTGLWRDLRKCLWPTAALNEDVVGWINPAFSPARVEKLRKNIEAATAAGIETGIDSKAIYDPDETRTLLVLDEQLASAKKHLRDDLDASPVGRQVALQPLVDALDSAPKAESSV